MTIEEVLLLHPGTTAEDWRPAGKGWAHEGGIIGEDAIIGAQAIVGARARIGERARVGAGARIGEGARLGEWARVGEGARVGDNVHLPTSPLYVIGTRHCLCEVGDGTIAVGCVDRTLDEWLTQADEIGERYGFAPQEIAEYKLYFELAAKLRALREEHRTADKA
jgi:carbonic anhydrase/acetyltransferase-like protein (isoleucine patch superfamily)